MADAVLTFALETVRDLLLEEARFLFNVKGEVEEIGAELERMRDFLERADAEKDEDKLKALHFRVKEIRGLAAEVEDVLETFAIEVASQKSKGGIKNALKRSARIVNEFIAVHKVGSEIVRIKTKITNFTSSLPRYEIPRGGGESSDSSHKRRQQPQNYPHFEDDFLGMEDNINELVFHLVNEQAAKCQVVSIYGMGGLGKTSLAKQVYKHDEVQRHFHRFSWVCISQQWKTTNVLQEILKGLDPTNNEAIMRMSDLDLFKELYEVQKKEKCLVVIDDIWSTNDWDSLKHAFPIGKTQTGSKILLTTRDEEVAKYSDPKGFQCQPQCLSEEQSWELLQGKVFPRRDNGTGYIIDPRMEELAKEMVKQCRGLPLAVVVLGGILVLRDTAEKWEMVLLDINNYLAKGVLNVLDLSYKDLPYHLKRCFLFLANFPEDSNIKATKLYHLWIAERIVSEKNKKKGQTMMDVAEEYLVELAQRCTVQVHVKEEIGTTRRRIKSCRLHDMMRELCLKKVNDENFLKVINGSGVGNEECSTSTSSSSSSTSNTKTRRLSIHSNGYVDEYKMYLNKQRASHVRSLLIFEGGEGFWFKIKDCVSCFKLLSVLDLEGVDWPVQVLPKAIGKLTQLRYLNLRDTYIEKLPTSIGELGYLETLDLKRTSMFIPNVLWKLQRLRHLYLPSSIEFDREKEKKLRLDGLNNLETLVGFDSEYFDVKDLHNFNNNLRKLYVTVQTNYEEDLAHLVMVVSSTNSLLRKSRLSISYCSFHSEEELEVLRKLLGCHHLNNLKLQGPVSKLPEQGPVSKLPEQCHFSPNLTKLFLWYTNLEDDPMPTLGKLPSLVYLKIERDVFMGKEMVCSSTDFLQLTYLRIWRGLPNLENWTVDQGAFPKLSILEIEYCEKLKMIPDGFAFLTALKELDIRGMPQGFVVRMKKGVDGKEGEDYHKLQHIPSIKINGKRLRSDH